MATPSSTNPTTGYGRGGGAKKMTQHTVVVETHDAVSGEMLEEMIMKSSVLIKWADIEHTDG